MDIIDAFLKFLGWVMLLYIKALSWASMLGFLFVIVILFPLALAALNIVARFFKNL